jgi:hypothetical protein
MLRKRFSPEYDRVVKEQGDIHRGEDVLQFREKRRENLHVVALSPSNRSGFEGRWNAVQSQFVDDSRGAVSLADQLVNEVMRTRGDHVGEQRAADICVDRRRRNLPRCTHDIASRHRRGQSSTEDLRKAMVHYRSLFDELLGQPLLERKEAQA